MIGVYFTADPHYGHANILKYTNRPFTNVMEMDKALIDNHNSVVGKNDHVYILGDFSFYDGPDLKERYFDKLNGKKILIKGNHDGNECLKLPWFQVHESLHLKVRSIPKYHNDSREIFLSHYSHRSWNKSFHGVPHIFGHSHSRLPPYGKSFDVGVDCWNYKPISLDEVFQYADTLSPSTD